MEDHEIQLMSKIKWKKYVKEQTKMAALRSLVYENSSKKKTKTIMFSDLEMSEYLQTNVSLTISRIIFSLRSKTLDIKEFQPWKYFDNICVKCKTTEETIQHFLTCSSYQTETEICWEDVNENNIERQIEIAKIVEKRMKIRQVILYKEEDRQASTNCGSGWSNPV